MIFAVNSRVEVKQSVGVQFSGSFFNLHKRPTTPASSLQIRLFADDTSLFHESKNLVSLQRYVNKEMLKNELWLIVNKTILKHQ